MSSSILKIEITNSATFLSPNYLSELGREVNERVEEAEYLIIEKLNKIIKNANISHSSAKS